jgi:S1-C subfamily serine protease
MKKFNLKVLVFISLLSIFLFACRILSTPAFEDVSPLKTVEATTSITTQPTRTVPTPQASDGQTVKEPLQTTLGAQSFPNLVDLDGTLIALYEKVNPGVVAIQVLTQDGGGLGSGFVYDKEGHIVTNYHVIEGFNDLEVDFPSGFKARGEVIGTDTDSDLAVVKVEASAEELFPLTLGDSSQLKVGQTVIAIGNPFGLNGSMTTGIVSALGRTLDSMRAAPGGNNFTAGDIIQTDTAINPGNSGGPLINLDGEVIGINRAIRTLNFSADSEPVNSGIGFAVAINIVKRVVPALIDNGVYDYPYIGISSLDNISLLEQEALGLPSSIGAYVTSVSEGSPAADAGLRGGDRPTNLGITAGGDLITAIDSQPVRNFSDLLSYLINYKNPGDKVLLTVVRDNKTFDMEVTLDRRP